MGTILSSPAPADPPNQLKSTQVDLLKRHDYSGVSFHNLGLYLGLSPARLDVIKENNKGDVIACLRECLKAWLKKADDVVKKGGPTVFSLVSALRKLGENVSAEGILVMEKHPACRILARHASNQSLVTAQLPQMVNLLNSDMHINEMVCVKKEEDMLLIEIVKAVCIDSNMLEVFAGILLQYKSTVTMEIGNTIMREYRKAYCCGESKDDNAKQDEICLPPFITAKFKSMRVKLSFTFDQVELIINACPPSTLDKIKNALRYYSEDLKPQVVQCQNIHDILDLVSRNCSLDDIEMLKAIINELDIERAKVVVQEYSDALEEFSKTELSKCLNEKFSYASPLQCERITIVVDRNTDECTLNDVRRLSANVFHKLSPQNSRCIKLNVIKDDNSFTITCSFPLILSEQLITAALNNIDVLKENKVKKLTIGYCTVYEVNDTSTVATMELNKHEYISSLSTSSGLMKQLMLSLSVQLINSKEEVTTLNEEILRIKETAESFEKEKSLKETLKKQLNACRVENEILKTKATETKQLLQEKESHLTEREEELKEIRKLPEEQLALFESEKEEIKQSAEKPIVGKIKEQGKDMQLVTQQELTFEIESLKREIKQKDDKIKKVQASLAESKQGNVVLQEKITMMNLQHIEKDKKVQERTKFQQKTENLCQRRRKDFLLFEDDIYGDIIIDHPLIIKIVQSRQFQRLKKISTLGYTYENKTKANYTKLQHSIGMYYLAGEYVKQLQRKQPELNITESDVLCVEIAALCFNLGVGPFSHIFGLFLKEICQKQHIEKPWDNFSEASVNMFQYMLEDNEDLMDSFIRYEVDITFIKELMREKRKMQCIQDKEFLYEIILNESQMNVKVIDYTTRDAAVLGAKINFKWRVFLAKVYVLRCDDGKLHICFHEDDLETYNGFFSTHSRLYRDLYYVRKIRIVALMIKVMLTRANNTELIQDIDRKVTISDAARSMAAYTQLTDSVLILIRQSVKDPLVQALLDCLDESKFIAEIGYIIPPEGWNKNPDDLKEAIVEATGDDKIECNLIIDLVLNGYEGHEAWTQYYYRDDDSTGKWTDRWAQERYHANLPWRVFFVSGDRGLIKTVQEGFKKAIKDLKIQTWKLYPPRENYDLMPAIS